MQNTPTTWLVGATFADQKEDRAADMVAAGEWYHNFPPSKVREHHLTREMAPGDRIALKATFVQKNNLPFDAGGRPVSLMRVKAVGVVRANPGDGYRVFVDWDPTFRPREWYFSTYQPTLTRLRLENWKARALHDFLFENADQDIARFVAEWRETGRWDSDDVAVDPTFAWIPFYEEFATRLLDFRHRRTELVAALAELRESGLPVLLIEDQQADGSSGQLTDICPFTFMATFNRSLTVANRTAIAERLGQTLGVTRTAPTGFQSIPLVNNQNTWFFSYAKARGAGDIEAHWNLLASALDLAADDSAARRQVFADALSASQRVRNASWNLTQALYWVRPRRFVPLDGQSREYLSSELNDAVDLPPFTKPPAGHRYLQLCDDLLTYFAQADAPPRSFPEFSLAAYNYKAPVSEVGVQREAGELDEAEAGSAVAMKRESNAEPYTVDDIIHDGCFIARAELLEMLDALRTRKNVILQGPPGAGKTWLAKRLCWAHFGVRDVNRLVSFQFHPNLSYEDFVLGFRPGVDGRLELRDGSFVAFCEEARHAGGPHAVVIEEINRGNPSQILGELLTLLEADKRDVAHALRLSYGERANFWVPAELVVVGTMNVADRSLAMVDVALRRRFAFFTLEPNFDAAWQAHVQRDGVPAHVAESVASRMRHLNATIQGSPGLGANFRVGHSYFVPPYAGRWDADWALRVFKTEIVPLVREYFFDDSARADELTAALTAPIPS